MKKSRLINILLAFSVLFSGLVVMPVHAAAILRAKQSGLDAGACGSSWENACTLRRALALAASGDQIWVAKGTHEASATADPLATFQLKNGVAIYGGFAGGETNLEQRDWRANKTILNGWYNGTQSSYHVVTGSGTNASAILDGFSVGFGNAINTQYPHAYGAGILNISGSPTLVNLILDANLAETRGGGMYNENSSPTLKNVIFLRNNAMLGGGMYNGANSNPVLINVLFIKNSADMAGAMYNAASSPTIINNTFTENEDYHDGEIINLGGIYNAQNSHPTFYNSILWGDEWNEMLSENGSVPTVHYSLVQGGCPASAVCDHVLALDPQFVRQPVVNDDGDIRLKYNSPAIDAGINSALPSNITLDLNGKPRFVDVPPIPDSGNGNPPIVDLGAYEAQQPIIYVKNGGTGTDCTSWSLACSDLQVALARSNYPSQEVWVAAGVYKPTSGTDRTATFQLRNDLAIYGGFAGTESSLSQRIWQSHPTILSGDIGIAGDFTDNSFHVVSANTTNPNARLDGFTVTGGNANGNASDTGAGGGLINYGGSQVITNIIFSGNYGKSGGGMYNFGSVPGPLTIENITFSDNTAVYGGGLYEVGGNFNVTMKNLTFINNSANFGGGMMIYFSPGHPVINTYFYGNKAEGANACGGGLQISNASTVTIVNAAFIGNDADMGGGICVDSSNPGLINLSFFNNSAHEGYGGAVRILNGTPSIYNSIFWGDQGGEFNSPPTNLHYSFVQGAPNDAVNQVWGDRDPLYIDAANGNLQLPAASPAIDFGDNNAVPIFITNDLAGNVRMYDYPGIGTDSDHTIDLGAYELMGPYKIYAPAIFK